MSLWGHVQDRARRFTTALCFRKLRLDWVHPTPGQPSSGSLIFRPLWSHGAGHGAHGGADILFKEKMQRRDLLKLMLRFKAGLIASPLLSHVGQN